MVNQALRIWNTLQTLRLHQGSSTGWLHSRDLIHQAFWPHSCPLPIKNANKGPLNLDGGRCRQLLWSRGRDYHLTSRFAKTRSLCIHLNFSLSNNQVEYEALILAMYWAEVTWITLLEILRNSQVVVKQEYKVHSKNLMEYATHAIWAKSRFSHFTLNKVSHENNVWADYLAKIALGEVMMFEPP